jgi:hypothetical protein
MLGFASETGTKMKTSIRLALTALAVSGVTLAASGKPLPFLDPTDETIAARSAPLPPASPDGDAPAAGRAEGVDTHDLQ